ncbi:MAG: hypothetical protein LC631_05235, partial [Desulfovibrionales bacterium]|nr:hypothetical protein [Desulfovibrionales bacterium]
FMIAHDRFLLSKVAKEVWSVDNCGIVQHGVDFDQFYRNYIIKTQENIRPDSLQEGSTTHKKEECSQKQKRRQEAQLRNEIYQLLKPLKQEYSLKEVRLEKCLIRQEEVETTMALPETYQEPEKFKALSKEYQSLVEENENLMHSLESLEKKIMDLESKKP